LSAPFEQRLDIGRHRLSITARLCAQRKCDSVSWIKIGRVIRVGMNCVKIFGVEAGSVTLLAFRHNGHTRADISLALCPSRVRIYRRS